MRRVLLDSDGSLRVTALIALVLLVPAVVLALASWGGWWAVAGITVLLTGCLAAMVRLGKHASTSAWTRWQGAHNELLSLCCLGDNHSTNQQLVTSTAVNK